jgi:AcrR family transcriptional regulator
LKQAERRDRTRAALIESAKAVFGHRGFHGATLDEIAQGAGVSKGALYYNFASKEDLFLALLDARMEERLREIVSAFGAEGPDGGVDRAALDYVVNLKHNREWITLFFEFLAYAARDAKFATRLGERFNGFWAALAAVVERQGRERRVRLPLPAEHLAIAIDLLGIGFMIPRVVGSDAVPDDLLGRVLGYVLRGVAQDAEPLPGSK